MFVLGGLMLAGLVTFCWGGLVWRMGERRVLGFSLLVCVCLGDTGVYLDLRETLTFFSCYRS